MVPGVQGDSARSPVRRNTLGGEALKQAAPTNVVPVMTMMTLTTSRRRNGNQRVLGAEELNQNLGVSAPRMSTMIPNRSAAAVADGPVLQHHGKNCPNLNLVRSRSNILLHLNDGSDSSGPR
mmetsp:Transcript_38610/g.74919  ORF Transcript_38610/g.74919 Transcript_38610/m.74919 type:complete len:122 (+) Transcript_38610:488-853(+)